VCVSSGKAREREERPAVERGRGEEFGEERAG
jgi:hypothetical protein